MSSASDILHGCLTQVRAVTDLSGERVIEALNQADDTGPGSTGDIDQAALMAE